MRPYVKTGPDVDTGKGLRSTRLGGETRKLREGRGAGTVGPSRRYGREGDEEGTS